MRVDHCDSRVRGAAATPVAYPTPDSRYDRAMTPRLAAWVALLALVSGWWLTSLARQPIARVGVISGGEQLGTTAPTHAQFTERLQRRLRDAPKAPSPHRNPFFFASRTPAVAGAPAPVFAPPPVPITEPHPSLSLAGVATNETADGPVRTAVLSTDRGIVLAKVDDVLPNGLRVVSIDEDHVVLVDGAGAETKLYLK